MSIAIYKKLKLAALLVITTLLTSCLKNDFENDATTVSSFSDLSVPTSFNFSTTQNVTLNFKITNGSSASGYSYVAKVYNAAPDKNGTVLVIGAFDNTTFSYNEVITVPTYQTDIFVEIYSGSDIIYSSTASIVNNAVSITVNNSTLKNAAINADDNENEYVLTGYTNISGNSSLNPKDGDKLRISSGATFNGGINYHGNGGTLYLAIEGTANFQYLNVNNGKLEVIIGSKGSTNSFDEVKKDITLKNYSNVLNAKTISGTIKNYSSANIAGNLNINSSGILENYSTLNIAGHCIVNSQSYFLNMGHTNVAGDFTINSNGKVDNSCSLIVSGSFNDNGNFNMSEGCYLNVSGESRFNNNATAVLARDSYLKTNIIWNDSQITGPKSGYAIVQYLASKKGNSKTYYTDNVYLIDANGKNENGNAVSFKISQSSCSPGYGKEGESNDRDGDGIANSLDNFPDDNQRAFSISSGSGTLLFEDQWPSLGDYDFNDLVVGYQYNYITNAKNEITGFTATFQVSAIGATLNNGFGFSLPVSGDQIKLVKGYSRIGSAVNLNANGTETGHSNESVIIVYDNLSVLGTMFNVRKGGTTKSVSSIQIDISFIGKVALSQLCNINPFIFVGQERGREVHLVGYAPTSLASTSYFGSGDDNSNSTFYTSKKGFPWAMNIPSGISYMQETIDFVKGYPDFPGWVQSGGVNNKDWYLKNTNKNFLY